MKSPKTQGECDTAVVEESHQLFLSRNGQGEGSPRGLIGHLTFHRRSKTKSVWFLLVDLEKAFRIKSTLDRGTRFRENTGNKGFRMISNWIIYFRVFLDRENRYINSGTYTGAYTSQSKSPLPGQHTLQRPRATLEPCKPIRATLEPCKPSRWTTLGVASEDALSDCFTPSVSKQEPPFSLTTPRKQLVV